MRPLRDWRKTSDGWRWFETLAYWTSLLLGIVVAGSWFSYPFVNPFVQQYGFDWWYLLMVPPALFATVVTLGVMVLNPWALRLTWIASSLPVGLSLWLLLVSAVRLLLSFWSQQEVPIPFSPPSSVVDYLFALSVWVITIGLFRPAWLRRRRQPSTR